MEVTLDTRALDLAAPMQHRPFRTACVLGAGTMGAQIAAHLANAGLHVYLLDVTPEAIGRKGTPNSIVEGAFKGLKKAKPGPFFTDAVAKRITLGNMDDDFERVGEVDWVIEAVVERLDVKRQVMERLEAHVADAAVVSTNTSGIPIHEITEGRGEGFRRRFLGTHFFNPPRYLQLLELIPTPDTAPEVLQRVAQFGRIHLGKGIVIANDVPYFVGNRVGVYGMMQAMRYFLAGDYTIEEIDQLTGPLVGRPKSATFRTADVVGLDVLRDVAKNLYEKATQDESRDAFEVPDVLDQLVEGGALGAKRGAGFYKKEGKTIKSIDPETGAYTDPAEVRLEGLDAIQKAGGVEDRLRALYQHDGRAGRFFRETTLDVLGYAARRVPEITDSPADVDRAMRWGFGWELGPFGIWDALGFEQVLDGMEEQGVAVPEWVQTMHANGHTSFYRTEGGERQAYVPGEGYTPDPVPRDQINLPALKSDRGKTLWKNKEATLLDLGGGVALYEFRSKGNSLGRHVIGGLMEVINKVENDPDLRGLVIGNEGKNFAVGANLFEVAQAAQGGQFDELEQYLKQFQDAVQRIRYATKPVVVAVHQRVLGGGCEMVMACPHPVASAESYIGLVELGVGLIPAGTGTMRLAAQAAEKAPTDFHSHVQPFVQQYFEQIARADVATSARQAQDFGYLSEDAVVVMHDDRRLYAAKQEVLRLSEEGYLPPPVLSHVLVTGRGTRAAFEVALQQFRDGDFISDYDLELARGVAYVLTGGDLSAPQEVHEDYLLELEREVFLRLLGNEKTQTRIEHMLKTGKPLRN